MEFEVEYDVAGSFPESGAIFMSNVSTKRECFRRKLLGLPFAQANFVKQIKAGMVLFLFEFERRELYGVFRACSDGSTNIVPHAFTSSGKQFPAQVCFTPIWYCHPLSEHEFQDAIKENYFSKKKFNFGLSEDQVRRLLCLFSSRKLQTPQRPLSRKASKSVGKQRSIAGEDSYVLRNRAEKFVEEDSLVSGIDAKYPRNSSSNNERRLDGNRFMKSDGIKNDHNVNSCQGHDVLTEPPSAFLGKRRRNDDDEDMFFMQDSVTDDHDLDHGLGRVIHIDHPGDFSDKPGRVAEECKFSLTKHTLGSNTGPIATPKYFWESLAKVGRATDNGRFPKGDILGDEYTPEHGFGLVTSMDPLENSAIKARRASDKHGADYRVENDYSFENYPEPTISTDRRLNTLGRLRSNDQGMVFGNDRTEIEQYADNGMGEVRKETGDGIFLRSDRADVPSEHFANRLDCASMANDHDRFLARVSVENAQNTKSRYPLDKIRQLSDEGILKKTDRLDNAYNLQNSFGLENSSALTNLCQSRQNPFFFSSKPNFETKNSFSQDQPKLHSAFPPSMEPKIFDFSCPTSHGAMVTRTVSYDPELPGIHHRNQSSFAVDCTSRPVLDFPPHQNSNRNLFDTSLKRSSPYLGRDLDVAYDFGTKVPLATSPNCYTGSGLQTSSSLFRGDNREKMEARATSQEDYKGLLVPEYTSASPPYSRSDMYERKDTSPFVEFDKHAVTSEGRCEHKIRHRADSQTFRGYDSSFNSDTGYLHSGSSHEKSNNPGYEYIYQGAKGTPTDCRSKRTSVFARLTSASEVHIPENDSEFFGSEEEESNYDLQYDDMGASVDQVMDTLHDILDHRITKARKSSSVIKQDMECDKLKMLTLKMENVVEHVIEENGNEIAPETRVVRFKRRSETKKNKEGAKAKTSVDTSEHEREGSVQKSVREGLEGKHAKRRKLVRPVFGKKEQLNEGLGSDGRPKFQLSSSEGSSKDGTGNLDVSVKSQDNEKCSSPNRMLGQMPSISGCEGNNANFEPSSYCGGKRSVNYDRKESFDGGIKRASTSDLQVSSHEGFNAKENSGSCGLTRSHESDNIYQNVGFMHVINPNHL